MSSKSLAHLLLQRKTASQSSIVRLPNFFSAAEIAQVFDARDEHHRRLLGPPPMARQGWRTTYLSAGGLFRAKYPELHARLRSLRHEVDLSIINDVIPDEEKSDARSALLDDLEMRCIELHESGPGGSLNDPGHFDNGSVVTADVLLEDGFDGGSFSTRDGNGTVSTHLFERGDAIVFPAYKYHSVAPIVSGRRVTLVVEFWQGDENQCNHRCDLIRGEDGITKLCPDATLPGCPDLVVVSFSEPGSFGCGFGFHDESNPNEIDPETIRDGRPVVATVSEVRNDVQAGDHPHLVVGLVLTHVGRLAVRGMGFTDLDAVLAEAVGGGERPVEMRFTRPIVDITEP
mmetsp:Transcript_38686/g.93150  ORF Transcript_38686/g.93150 Transcript_38686/m.93150 type:complete len:344 (-) Transcript_38686:24-1055(-)